MKSPDLKQKKWYFFHKRHRSPFFHQIALSSASIRNSQCPFDNRTPGLGAFLGYVAIDKHYQTIARNRTF